MTTVTDAGGAGYVHEAAIYDSDEEFITMAAPFLRDGLAAREPTFAALDEHHTGLIRAALGDAAAEIFLLGGDGYRAGPAAALHHYYELCSTYTAAGAARIRVIGQVPHPGTGAPWGWWARYEAAINHAFRGLPIWNVCPYDTRRTAREVLDDAERTHPYLATADGEHRPNPRYRDPAECLTRPVATDPIETSPPLVTLADPTPGQARQATRDAGAASHLDAKQVADLVFAVSEVVTNAGSHGRPPVRLRLWSAPDRVIAVVTDQGPGPSDPAVGLLPSPDSYQRVSHLASNGNQGAEAHLSHRPGSSDSSRRSRRRPRTPRPFPACRIGALAGPPNLQPPHPRPRRRRVHRPPHRGQPAGVTDAQPHVLHTGAGGARRVLLCTGCVPDAEDL